MKTRREDPQTPSSQIRSRAGAARRGLSPHDPGSAATAPPRSSTLRRLSVWLVPLALTLIVAVAVAAAFVGVSEPPPEGPPPPVLTLDDDGLRLVYHVPTGTSALFDTSVDPRCRSPLVGRDDDVEDLQKQLAKKMGVSRLDEFGEHYRLTVRQLRSLGYL